MKFKTRMINAAVAAALGTVAGAAQAVNISVDGGGSALIYPYYTMQTKGMNPFDTYLSVVNTDSQRGKAVKVRVLEPKNSKEVLDFNLYLSPNDVWTASITRDSAGNPILRTTDNSCTSPQIPVVSTVGTIVTREVAFVNFAYATDFALDGSLARAREGYVEMLLMADISSGATYSSSGTRTLLSDITHNTVGVPANCAAVSGGWSTGNLSTLGVGVTNPTGTLFGAETIINALEGIDISTNAVALANWSVTNTHSNPGALNPNLADVNPQVSLIMDGANSIVTDWSGFPNISPVSAVFMRDAVYNEFVWGSGAVGLNTDWVVNFPTKVFHIAYGTSNTKTSADKPFTSSLTTSGACEAITLVSYNREEASSAALSFSPSGTQSLCWEVNVLSWGSSNVLGAQVTRSTIAVPYSEGWGRLTFGQTWIAPTAATSRSVYGLIPLAGTANVTTSTLFTATYTGLPVLGFATATFVNNSSLASYGTLYDHRYSRKVSP